MNEQRESYHNYMGRRMREEDAKMATENVMDKADRSIWVTFRKEGVHMYPGADIFHFKVRIEVFHNDRDIEFIQFKRWMERLYAQDVIQLDHKSCEMIADDLYKEITAKYPSRFVEIDVAEDGENGCSIFYHRC
jgi:hypothetical protein